MTKLLNYTDSFVNFKASPTMKSGGVAAASALIGTAAMRKPKAPEVNRARIVQAAMEEFASRGFKGASMDAIAARTHTTRAMINYYFGGKEKLYLSVLEHVYSEIRQAEGELELEHLDPVEAMRRIVQFTFHYYIDHENFVRLVIAENQAEGRHLKKSKAMRTLNRPILELLSRVIARGQLDGSFRRGIEPLDVHMAIAALGNFNVSHQHTFSAIFQRDMGAKGDVRGRCAVVTDLILSYLSNSPPRTS
ncbi:MAG: TetR/AcrR family transcriptional regulator [Burkholderiaceae bacterium]